MRKLVWAVALLALGMPVEALDSKVATLVYAKDVTDTSYTYCSFLGNGGDPYGSRIPGTGRIETSGSSTTVTAETAGDVPFTSVVAGDLLVVDLAGVPTKRRVATKVSATEITVDTAINTTGSVWGYYRASCGSAVTDGWVGMSGAWAATFEVDVATINATSIDYQVQCKVPGATGVQLAAGSITTATTAQYSLTAGTSGSWDACRVGLKLTADGGAQSVSAYVDRADLPAGSIFEVPSPATIYSKTLTEGAETAVVEIAVPQTAGANYADAVVEWVAFAADATNVGLVRGSSYIAAVNEAGTEACTIGAVGTAVEVSPVGSLTCTATCVVGLTDAVRFALNCTSSLTQTSLYALATVTKLKPNTVTAQ